MRAFFAVELPAALRHSIAECAAQWRAAVPDADIAWTDPSHYHVTLKFLGDIAELRLPQLLRGALSKLASSEPFAAELAGPGAFPNARGARVAWIGVGAGSGELARLARRLDAASARLGVPREARPYHAHITVGRLREPQPLPVLQFAAPAGAFPVSEVVLFESQLGSAGARYRPCARIALPPTEESAGDALADFA